MNDRTPDILDGLDQGLRGLDAARVQMSLAVGDLERAAAAGNRDAGVRAIELAARLRDLRLVLDELDFIRRRVTP